ncbi:MAG: hypothetical protein WCJ30_24875 [Deltaproteobacteria bacterium]
MTDAGALDATDAASVPDGIDASSTDGCPSRDVFAPVGDATSCPAGVTLCGSTCVDLRVDRNNCGACGAVCGAGQTCSSGSCACGCSAGRTVCWTGCGECLCTDLATDPAHCGTCGTVCNAGTPCVSGTCAAGDAGPG